MLLLLGYFLLYTLTSQLKYLALPYYCNYVLGTYQDGITQILNKAKYNHLKIWYSI